MYILWHSVIVAFINALSLYRVLHLKKNSMPLRRFQASVGFSLVSAGKTEVGVGFSSSIPSTTFPTSTITNTTATEEVAIDQSPSGCVEGYNHFTFWKRLQRCKRCPGHFSHACCGKCNLCLNKDRNCFHDYHSLKNEEGDVLVITFTAVFMTSTCHNKRKLLEKVAV